MKAFVSKMKKGFLMSGMLLGLALVFTLAGRIITLADYDMDAAIKDLSDSDQVEVTIVNPNICGDDETEIKQMTVKELKDSGLNGTNTSGCGAKDYVSKVKPLTQSGTGNDASGVVDENGSGKDNDDGAAVDENGNNGSDPNGADQGDANQEGTDASSVDEDGSYPEDCHLESVEYTGEGEGADAAYNITAVISPEAAKKGYSLGDVWAKINGTPTLDDWDGINTYDQSGEEITLPNGAKRITWKNCRIYFPGEGGQGVPKKGDEVTIGTNAAGQDASGQWQEGPVTNTITIKWME